MSMATLTSHSFQAADAALVLPFVMAPAVPATITTTTTVAQPIFDNGAAAAAATTSPAAAAASTAGKEANARKSNRAAGAYQSIKSRVSRRSSVKATTDHYSQAAGSQGDGADRNGDIVNDMASFAQGLLHGGLRKKSRAGHEMLQLDNFLSALGVIAQNASLFPPGTAKNTGKDLLLEVPWSKTRMTNPVIHHVFFKYFTTRHPNWRDILFALVGPYVCACVPVCLTLACVFVAEQCGWGVMGADAGFQGDLETTDILPIDATPMLLTATEVMFLDARLQVALVESNVDLRWLVDEHDGKSFRTVPRESESEVHEATMSYGLSLMHSLFATTAAEMQKQILKLYKAVAPYSRGFARAVPEGTQFAALGKFIPMLCCLLSNNLWGMLDPFAGGGGNDFIFALDCELAHLEAAEQDLALFALPRTGIPRKEIKLSWLNVAAINITEV